MARCQLRRPGSWMRSVLWAPPVDRRYSPPRKTRIKMQTRQARRLGASGLCRSSPATGCLAWSRSTRAAQNLAATSRWVQAAAVRARALSLLPMLCWCRPPGLPCSGNQMQPWRHPRSTRWKPPHRILRVCHLLLLKGGVWTARCKPFETSTASGCCRRRSTTEGRPGMSARWLVHGRQQADSA